MSIKQERIVGLVTLSVLAALSLVFFLRSTSDQVAVKQTIATSVKYALSRSEHIIAPDLTRSLKVRDPVFLKHAAGSIVQAGYIEGIKLIDDVSIAEISWHNQDVSAANCRFVAYQNRGRLDDAIALLFPVEKRKRMERLISNAMVAHGDRITASLAPIVERSMRDSLPAIESGLRASIEKHRDELDAIGGRWNDQIIAGRLLPLAKTEIVPIVRRRGEPLAAEIGRELWERASIWSFAWRAIYDKAPLPKKDMIKQEWDRFVEEEAIPILENHASEIAVAIQQIMIEVAENPKVRHELSAAADEIASDPESRALLKSMLRESIVDNQTLRKVWADHLTTAEAREAIEEAGKSLEPMIRQIGDEIMGTREQGIAPGFARLLRNQILQKDKRWVMAIAVNDKSESVDTLVIEAAIDQGIFPMPILAGADDGND